MLKPANHNIRLTIAYDGTNYLGWQKTKMGPSVQEALEKAIEKILQHKVRLQAASRTDAGVHATGQVVNFFTSRHDLNLNKLLIGINSQLPKDVVAMDIEETADTFHPTLDNAGKEYHYNLCYGAIMLPHHRLYTWHYPYPLNLDLMRQATEIIVGERNFKAFCNAKKNEKYGDHVRNITSIKIIDLPHFHIRFEIKGRNFLYKMARNIVGTLVYVGCGKINIDDLNKILDSTDRTLSGITAPAHGLFLHQVILHSSDFYP